MKNPVVSPLLTWLGRLSFPRLFAVTAALFFLDMLVPDFIPFVDEILLGLGTLLLSRLKRAPASTPTEGEAKR